METKKDIIVDKASSFLGIFQEELGEHKVERIKIPRIQRDYAQGRRTDKIDRIRNRFLDVLYKALVVDTLPQKLDFVYGSVRNGELIPLDGQQRLTTLYLLHWYIAVHENVGTETLVGRFTYDTRFSSRDFCQALIERYKPDLVTIGKLSDDIIDQSWFKLAWRNDPTIEAMLVMLDAIHAKFVNTSGIWDKLSDTNNPVISFYFLPIENLGQTDSLYVKMNSRGKPLTEFEHFKAHFEKIIDGVSSKLREEFSQKIDNEWTDLLWPYRGDDNIIDDEFMRYYRYVTDMLCYEKYDAEDTKIRDEFELAEKVYGSNNVDAQANIQTLFTAFDCWTPFANKESGNKISDLFSGLFTGHKYIPGKVKIYDNDSIDIFRKCCDNYEIGRNRGFTLSDSLLLYAVLVFAQNHEALQSSIAERIRIIRNLIWRSAGDEIREDRMKVLLAETRDIITDCRIDIESPGYSKVQKQEELEKIKWRKNKNGDAIDELNHLEDHFLLQGTVKIIDIESDEFGKRAKMFRMIFDSTAYETGAIDYRTISRALLSIGNYSQNIRWRTFLGGINNSSWQELFSYSSSRNNFDNTKKCLEQLLDKIHVDQDIVSQLKHIIDGFVNGDETPKDWRYYFVKYPKMRSGASGVYWWKDAKKQYEVIMMNTSHSLNGYNWQPFLRQLSLDADLSGVLSLENYGDPIVLINEDKLTCHEDHWEICTIDEEISRIEIDQINGVDNEDRIEKIKKHIATRYSNQYPKEP